MTQPVTIKCLLRPIELQLVGSQRVRRAGKNFQLWVSGSEFDGHRFEISSGVCVYDPAYGLDQFFEDLAAHRVGWEGVKH